MSTSLFEILGQLFEWLGSWIPRLAIMPATHKGVRFRRGKHVSVIEPGLYIFWPIVTEVESLPIKRQTINLPTQTLKSKDNVAVAVNVIVVYEINDIERALVDTWDIEQTIGDIALAADVELVTGNPVDWLTANIAGDVQRELTRRCRSDLHPYGVRVVKAFLSDFCEATVVRLLGDDNAARNAPGLGTD